MRINVLSRREIEGIEWFYWPTAVISITDPTSPGFVDDGNEAKIASGAKAVLRLRFCDCDPDALERNFAHFVAKESDGWNRHRAFVDEQIAQSMKPEQAERIATFVREHNHRDALVIHCEAGISRSAGVAAALVAHDPSFVWENDSGGHFRPNAHVKSLVMKAMKGPR